MLSRGATKWFVGTEITFSLLFIVFSYVFVSYAGLKGVPIAYLVNYSVCFLFIFLNVKNSPANYNYLANLALPSFL